MHTHTHLGALVCVSDDPSWLWLWLCLCVSVCLWLCICDCCFYHQTIQDMKVEVTQARLETGKLLEAAELLEAEAEAKSDEKVGVS